MKYKIGGSPFKLPSGWIVNVWVKAKEVKTREEAQDITNILKTALKLKLGNES